MTFDESINNIVNVPTCIYEYIPLREKEHYDEEGGIIETLLVILNIIMILIPDIFQLFLTHHFSQVASSINITLLDSPDSAQLCLPVSAYLTTITFNASKITGADIEQILHHAIPGQHLCSFVS